MVVRKDAAEDCVQAQNRMEFAEDGREPYRQAWLTHFHRHFHIHRTSRRNKLHEIGLSDPKGWAGPSSHATSEPVSSIWGKIKGT